MGRRRKERSEWCGRHCAIGVSEVSRAVRRQLHKDDAVAAGDGLKAAEADDVRVLEHLEQPHFVLHGLLAHFPRIHQLCRHPLAALGVARGDDLQRRRMQVRVRRWVAVAARRRKNCGREAAVRSS